MIDLWLASLDEIGEIEPRWLTGEEQAKHRRFATPALQREYLVARRLSRWVLSQYAPVRPEDWRFEPTKEGRPFVAAPSVAVPSFNLAHSAGLVVCAVAPDRVGVDVESLARGADLVGMNVFAPAERKTLDARRAVELWTMKEAYLKARGSGIDMHLARLDITQPIDGYRIELVTLPQPWIGAVAVRGPDMGAVVLRSVGRDTFEVR